MFEIRTKMNTSENNIRNKKILIIGGSGSLGTALIRRLYVENELIIYSRDESKHWTLKNQWKTSNITFVVGDVRDYHRLSEAFIYHKPNIIIIAAALKHVDTCELSPFESIQTNINGTQNVITAVENNLDRLVPELETILMVSTDKACAPVNVYGMCKAISERLVCSRAFYKKQPKFVATRYGNVLESRGSIIPLFKHQAEQGKSFTVTHKDMTRFVMTLDDSIDLIQRAIILGKSGETRIPRLKAMKIMDLANIFSEKYNLPVEIIGMRPGEKIHESLICSSESVRVYEQGNDYIIGPQFQEVQSECTMFDYTSADDILSRNELAKYLSEIGLLNLPLDKFIGKRIEEIREN